MNYNTLTRGSYSEGNNSISCNLSLDRAAKSPTFKTPGFIKPEFGNIYVRRGGTLTTISSSSFCLSPASTLAVFVMLFAPTTSFAFNISEMVQTTYVKQWPLTAYSLCTETLYLKTKSSNQQKSAVPRTNFFGVFLLVEESVISLEVCTAGRLAYLV
ncbi:hypothetical protein T4A_10628 [Trichinella pseudospiralis]|uniref:Uncharacterized protein n=1 Tax=Trichinella pseudospiralis TaxID=6337 RepID=A0A0V1DUK1_TRIPS|nr:hypothetical protein T4A_10628 [Trichinella pseudospiralis]